MDALLMCGGRGTRLDAAVEKPLLPVGGEPMVDRVRAALAGSRVDAVHAVGSPAAPDTLAHLADADISGTVVEAPGEGYVADLEYALERVEPPVVTAVADLPLLAPDAVDAALDAHDGGSLTVCVPAALKRQLGVSVDATFSPDAPGDGPCEWVAELAARELAPTGLNVVGDGGDAAHVTHDARLAVNVNRREDVAVAEALLGGDAGAEEDSR